MKKFFYFSREAVIASLWPVSFIFLLVWSFKVISPVTGLLILLGSFLLQLAVSKMRLASKTNLPVWDWGHFDKFTDHRLPYLGGDGIITLMTNIIFNVLKVATVVCVVLFIYLKFPVNYLTQTGLILSIFVLVVVMLLMSKQHLHSYREARAYFGVISLACLIALTYITYKSQLIWIPLLLAVVMSSYKGFEEVGDIFRSKLHWHKIILTALSITAVVSTVHQFFDQIRNVFIGLFIWVKELPSVVMNFIMTPEAAPLGIGFIILFSAVALIFLTRSTLRSIKENSEQKIATEIANKRALEKMALEEKISKQFNDLLNCNFTDANKPFTLNDLLFIINNKPYLRRNWNSYKVALYQRLSKTNLIFFLQISHEKKQIVFDSHSPEIYSFYNEVYCDCYDDQILIGLGGVIQNLADFIKPLENYKGFSEIRKIITEKVKDFPKKYWEILVLNENKAKIN